jgi:hypothetical protein
MSTSPLFRRWVFHSLLLPTCDMPVDSCEGPESQALLVVTQKSNDAVVNDRRAGEEPLRMPGPRTQALRRQWSKIPTSTNSLPFQMSKHKPYLFIFFPQHTLPFLPRFLAPRPDQQIPGAPRGHIWDKRKQYEFGNMLNFQGDWSVVPLLGLSLQASCPVPGDPAGPSCHRGPRCLSLGIVLTSFTPPDGSDLGAEWWGRCQHPWELHILPEPEAGWEVATFGGWGWGEGLSVLGRKRPSVSIVWGSGAVSKRDTNPLAGTEIP